MKERIEILIDEKKLKKRVEEIAAEIEKDFGDNDLVLICVLKGGIIFMSDIARKIKQNVEFDFIDVSSYGNGTVSSDNIKLNKDLENSIQGKNIILLEDIIDTGKTLSYLIEYLKEKKPAMLKVCTLLDKPSRRVVDIPIDYVGFSVPDIFIVGYGLDYAQKYRNLPYIGAIHFE